MARAIQVAIANFQLPTWREVVKYIYIYYISFDTPPVGLNMYVLGSGMHSFSPSIFHQRTDPCTGKVPPL